MEGIEYHTLYKKTITVSTCPNQRLVLSLPLPFLAQESVGYLNNSRAASTVSSNNFSGNVKRRCRYSGKTFSALPLCTWLEGYRASLVPTIVSFDPPHSCFFSVLTEMLDSETKLSEANPSHPRVIGWSSSGKAFRIYDTNEFANVVLPKYFRTKKFSSFQRNLNLVSACPPLPNVSWKPFQID